MLGPRCPRSVCPGVARTCDFGSEAEWTVYRTLRNGVTDTGFLSSGNLLVFGWSDMRVACCNRGSRLEEKGWAVLGELRRLGLCVLICYGDRRMTVGEDGGKQN